MTHEVLSDYHAVLKPPGFRGRLRGQGRQALMLALLITTGSLLAACGPKDRPVIGVTPTIVQPIAATACGGTAAELLKPPLLDKESVAIYNGGIIVNMAGGIVDINVNVPNTTKINSELSLGLNLPPDTVKITYFFEGSFERADAPEQAERFFNAHRSYLFARYCQEQGKIIDSFVRTGISVYDALTAISRRNPGVSLSHAFWVSELEREVAEDYIYANSLALAHMFDQPINLLSSEAVKGALRLGLPFRVTRLFNRDSSNFN